ncbi:MAG: Major Facilitator Superfamily protein [Pelotomaculum sp. PtaU1.Bin035]|nr:MAG: Major Facilitator Superfamily protein [Pelotomaculum sp. PtaU1.Bin035]
MPKLNGKEPDFLLFCLSGAFLGIYTGLYDPTFNNYIAETFNISEATRGGIEFFRESPAVLVVFISGILMALTDVRIAIVSLLILSLGLLGQGFIAPTLHWAVVWMVMWSIGAHLYMPMSNSIVVSLSEPHEVGKKLGKWSGINAATSLIGYLVALVGFRYFNMNYRLTFGLAALAVIAAVICLLFMSTQKISRPGTSIVFKKRYSLYYFLSLLFGARKQIFLTFGPWVLIKVYHQTVATFALLGIAGTVLGTFFKPVLGMVIDRFGERIIIMMESVALVAVCLGYGFANSILPDNIALIFVYICFVGDNLLFACLMARATYLNKIVENKSDLTPTLSMGVSIDHIVSMTVPFFAGLLWENIGFKYVFLLAAALAIFNFWAATYIRTDNVNPQGNPAEI